MANEVKSTKVVTGKVRFSYLHVWEPQAIDGGTEKKYSVSLLINKSDTKTLAAINAAINAAKETGKGKWGGKVPPKLKLPLRDGDEERPDDPTYAGCYFLNATAKTKPGVVDKDVRPILDQEELYSGCFGRASITFFAFDTNGNRGIACGLNNIQKLEDGESLGGRQTAEADFAAVEDDLF